MALLTVERDAQGWGVHKYVQIGGERVWAGCAGVRPTQEAALSLAREVAEMEEAPIAEGPGGER